MRPTPIGARAPRPRSRAVVVAVLVLLLLSSNFIAYFYTDLLWFQEVGLTSVLWKSITTQAILGLVVGAFVMLVVWSNLAMAGRLGPTYRVSAAEPQRADPLDRYREALTPYLRWLRLGVAAFIGLVSGIVASAQWETVLLWMNKVPFGTRDAQFGKDVGFYVFDLPLYASALDQLSSILVITLLLVIGAHYFQGAIRPDRGLAAISSAALAHVSILLGAIALVKAAQYWLGQYELAFSPRGVVLGPSYTDVHAQIPALKLLAIISVLSALLFIANIWARRISLPLAAVAIWILFAFLAGGVWPWAVQRFSVQPQELVREEPYITRNIAATREGFGLADVASEPYPAVSSPDPREIAANRQLLQNVRLWDPSVLRDAYAQLQAIRPYYKFHDVDIDRYSIDGDKRQVLISARELSHDDLPESSQTWSNLRLQYTHGYGVVSSLASEATTSGAPSFLVKDIPGTESPGAEVLEVEQPSIYFGEEFEAGEYSIVNTQQEEIDYASEDGIVRSRYAGEGGVEVGSFVRKLAFAIREADTNMVLSGLIRDDSRVLYYRNIRDRVARAAPFLALDHDPYIAVVDGRLVWIIDAYTSTSYYPYAERFDTAESVEESADGLTGRINYVRNSVKVVVDAYDGTMDFHIVDEEDPLIRTWRNVFPALFGEEEPSESLREHFRYPEDLFELQSHVFLSYHIEDPEDFYAHEDEWSIPKAAAGVVETEEGVQLTTSDEEVDSTYLLIQLPGATEQEFVLTRPMTPRGKPNMVALLAARSDPERYGEVFTLEFPRDTLVPGPEQINIRINQDEEISPTLSLLRQRGSDVTFGSLVTLPIADSILYIQPLFVRAAEGGIPELTYVVLISGDEVVLGSTFEAALEQLFATGVDLGDPTGEAPAEEEPTEEEPVETPTGDPELEALVERAARLYERAQDALADGDFETYARLIEQLGRLLEEAQE
ncbi:MAG: UPF0182 family protein [Actinobacteria bacterium]|nr:UPF0182 family protein [Actinomycetota bacterium]